MGKTDLALAMPRSVYNWREDAACRDAEPELFYPLAAPLTPLWRAAVAEAAAVCDRCPVRDECLQWALDSGQEHGVWGGRAFDALTSAERRQLNQ